MKLFFAFILAAVFATVLAAPGTESTTNPSSVKEPATTAPSAVKKPGTPGDCSKTNSAPDTSNPNRFFLCANGKATNLSQACLPNEEYNVEKGFCDWKKKAEKA